MIARKRAMGLWQHKRQPSRCRLPEQVLIRRPSIRRECRCTWAPHADPARVTELYGQPYQHRQVIKCEDHHRTQSRPAKRHCTLCRGTVRRSDCRSSHILLQNRRLTRLGAGESSFRLCVGKARTRLFRRKRQSTFERRTVAMECIAQRRGRRSS